MNLLLIIPNECVHHVEMLFNDHMMLLQCRQWVIIHP
eukprot:UN11337